MRQIIIAFCLLFLVGGSTQAQTTREYLFYVGETDIFLTDSFIIIGNDVWEGYWKGRQFLPDSYATPPSLYEMIHDAAPPPDYSRLANTLKYSSISLAAFAGFAGGMGEGYLSLDGNWDTRSHRSHRWRDASILTGSASAISLGIGIGLKPKWSDVLFALENSVAYYLGTRIGYKVARW